MSGPSSREQPRPAFATRQIQRGKAPQLVTLAPGSLGIGTSSRLELLALDPDFCFEVPMGDLELEVHSAPVTSTRTSERARDALYKDTFKLACSGVTGTTLDSKPSSDFSSPSPVTALDIRPTRGIDDSAVQQVFRRAASRVDALLSALDCARQWPESRRSRLLYGNEQRRSLDDLFGPDLSADLVVDGPQPFGQVVCEAGDSEAVVNARMDRSAIRAANSILRLIGVASSDDSHLSFNQNATETVEDRDRQAAQLLGRACDRHRQGSYLRLVTATDAQAFRKADKEALNVARPDWLLVSGEIGSFFVHGIVESKPHAGRSTLQNLVTRRLDPLGANIVVEEPSPPQAAQTPASPRRSLKAMNGPFKGRLRKRAKLDLAEKDLTPERVLREREMVERGEFVDSRPEQKLLLQLASQLYLLRVSHGLLWAGWSHLLLPLQLLQTTRTAGGPRECALAFAPSMLDSSPPAPPPPTALESGPPRAADGQGAEEPVNNLLRIQPSPPNLILGLVQWALFAQHDSAPSNSVVALGSGRAQAAEAGQPGGGEGTNRSKRPSRGSGGRGESGATQDDRRGSKSTGAPGGRQDSMTDQADTDASGSLPASSSTGSIGTDKSEKPQGLSVAASTPPSSPPLAPSNVSPLTDGKPEMRVLPVARGRFADVHGGTFRPPGQTQAVECVFKVNRPAMRFDDESEELTRSDHDGGGPVGRFEREREVLEQLEALQGSVVPRLLGTTWVKTIFQPERTPALILEDVGVPISWDRHWPASVPVATRRKLVGDAFEALHGAGWLHGDVAPRNVLFSTTQASQGDGAQVRVCLVDLTRAVRFDREDERGARELVREQTIVGRMLANLFREAAPASRRWPY